jgi:hypothetical protein
VGASASTMSAGGGGRDTHAVAKRKGEAPVHVTMLRREIGAFTRRC